MNGFFQLVFLLPIFISALGQNALQMQVDDALKNDFFKYSNIGISVRDAKTSELLVNVNKDKLMVPGSTIKIITTVTALEVLGENFKFETQLSYSGHIAADGVLKGNIYIEGTGDPTLGTDRIKSSLGMEALIEKFVTEIRAKGIICIEGDIICINPKPKAIPIEDTWQWQDLGNYYATGSWPLNINENLYNIYYNRNFNVGQSAKISYIEPYIPKLQVESEVKVAAGESQDNAYIFGPALQYQKLVLGTIPQGKNLYKVKGAIPDPPQFLAYLLHQALGQDKISESRYLTMKAIPIESTLLYKHKSPTLSDIVKMTNTYSINLYADALVQALNPQKGIFENIKILKEKLHNSGADTMLMDIKDGSGLSARNLITADQMSTYICHVFKNHDVNLLEKMLPVVGEDGTIKNLLNNSPAKGKMWLKSGSMRRILCYSGIAKGKSGRLVALTIYLNGSIFIEHKINKKEVEKILETIYNHT